jgi:Asp/Glu/hydantoin racemase
VDEAKASVKVPFIRVDEAMADEAVANGKRIGVLATLFTTLKPTADLIAQRAAIAGKQVEVETVLCQGAFEALGAGKTDVHDRVVKENLKGLMERVDVVVLAQASMARVVDQLSAAERKAPILSSPRFGVLRLKGVLESLKQEA